MKTLGKILSAALLCVACAGYASAPRDKITPLGNETFSLTREAKTAFNRDTDKLKEQVTDAAMKFCEAQGKVMRQVSLTDKVPMFGTGYASATIVFLALPSGDPGLTGPLPGEGGAGSSAPAQRTLSNSTDDLVSALTKLDDLRKKGILTDDEFQAEKKKILSRSN